MHKGVQDTRFGVWAKAREEFLASFAELPSSAVRARKFRPLRQRAQ